MCEHTAIFERQEGKEQIKPYPHRQQNSWQRKAREKESKPFPPNALLFSLQMSPVQVKLNSPFFCSHNRRTSNLRRIGDKGEEALMFLW
jgi:hypothetical protein